MNNNSDGYKPFVADDWSLTPGFMENQDIELTLVELLALDEKDFDTKEKPATISTRCTQPTITALLHLLSITERVSVSRIQRVATKQGLLLIREDAPFSALQAPFRDRLEGIRLAYNADRSSRLGSLSKLLPTDASNDRDNIRTYYWVHGALEEMSYRTGIYVPYIAIFCMLYSLATVSDLGAYRPVVLRDIERFRERLTSRARELTTLLSR